MRGARHIVNRMLYSTEGSCFGTILIGDEKDVILWVMLNPMRDAFLRARGTDQFGPVIERRGTSDHTDRARGRGDH